MCEVLPYWPPAIQICTGSDCTGSHWFVWFAWKPEQEYSPTSSTDALGINSVEELTPTALDGISSPSSLDHSYPSTGSEVQQVIIIVSPSWTLPLLAMGVAVIPVWSTDYYSEYSVHDRAKSLQLKLYVIPSADTAVVQIAPQSRSTRDHPLVVIFSSILPDRGKLTRRQFRKVLAFGYWCIYIRQRNTIATSTRTRVRTRTLAFAHVRWLSRPWVINATRAPPTFSVRRETVHGTVMV